MVWQLDASGGLGRRSACTALALPEKAQRSAPPMIRALDCCSNSTSRSTSFIVGTASCDIWAVEEGAAPDMLLVGHSTMLRSVTTNPRREFNHVFATVSNVCHVAIWSSVTHQVSHSLRTLNDPVPLQGSCERSCPPSPFVPSSYSLDSDCEQQTRSHNACSCHVFFKHA
jgi:hypothetical protein